MVKKTTSYKNSIIKSVIYRIYASFISLMLLSYFFGFNQIFKLLSYSITDLFISMIAYFIFERLWISYVGDKISK